ncbi:MAG: hypothetical protein EOM24_20015 [Chloroflexia bacterium]|nr:hypothetical protein [Chloroflexia bacterium]
MHAAQALLTLRPEATRLSLSLPDGVPTDEPAAMVGATVATVRRQGTLVVGVPVGPREQLAALRPSGHATGRPAARVAAGVGAGAPAGGGHAAARTLTEAGLGPAVIVHRSHAPPLLTALPSAVGSGGVLMSRFDRGLRSVGAAMAWAR